METSQQVRAEHWSRAERALRAARGLWLLALGLVAALGLPLWSQFDEYTSHYGPGALRFTPEAIEWGTNAVALGVAALALVVPAVVFRAALGRALGALWGRRAQPVNTPYRAAPPAAAPDTEVLVAAHARKYLLRLVLALVGWLVLAGYGGWTWLSVPNDGMPHVSTMVNALVLIGLALLATVCSLPTRARVYGRAWSQPQRA